MALPLTILGTVVVAVARELVPNCSAAMVTNKAQYPLPTPKEESKLNKIGWPNGWVQTNKLIRLQ